MGIDNLQPWLRRTFSGRGKGIRRHFRKWNDLVMGLKYSNDGKFHAKWKDKGTSRLFIDFNAVIHEAVNEVYGIGPKDLSYKKKKESPESWWVRGDGNGVASKAFEIITKLITIAKPRDLLYLGYDGVVTKAKLMQQRERTYSSTMQSSGLFDRSQIKPGTSFMLEISAAIKRKISISRKHKILSFSNGEELLVSWPSQINISDASKHGEGEHKIMAKLNEKGKIRPRRDTLDVIYSPDADVSLLIMLHAKRDERPVIRMRQRHSWKTPKRDEETEDDENYEVNEDDRWEYFNTTGIRDDLGGSFGIPHIPDFIAITIFAGNDFLPGIPCSKDGRNIFNNLVSAYKIAFGTVARPDRLVVGDSIDWLALNHFLRIFSSEHSQRMLTSMYYHQNDDESKIVVYDQDNQIAGDRRWKVLEDSFGSGHVNPFVFRQYYNRYTSGVFSRPSDIEDMDLNLMPEMAYRYLSGISWILAYYKTSGKVINVRWAYGFHYAPTILDLMDELESKKFRGDWAVEPMNTTYDMITPVEHLLTILPKSRLYLVPRLARALFLESMPDLYPEEVHVDYSFVPFLEDEGLELHRATILTNFPSIQRIHETFLQIEHNPSIVKANV